MVLPGLIIFDSFQNRAQDLHLVVIDRNTSAEPVINCQRSWLGIIAD
jgi:hypothetical protein